MTIIFVASAFYAISREPGFTVTKTGAVLFPELVTSIDSVGKIVIRSRKQSMTMLFDKDKWVMQESDSYPIQSRNIKKVILELSNLRYFDVKTKNEGKHSKLDLRNLNEEGSRGRRAIIYDLQGKKLAEAIFGKEKYNMPGINNAGIYFRWPNDPQSWLASGQLEMSRSPEDWLESKIVDIDRKEIKEVKFAHSDGEVLTISKQVDKNTFVLQERPSNTKLKYDSDPENMATVLEGFELENVKKAGSIEFGRSDIITANFSTFDGLELTLRMVSIEVKDEEELDYWVEISASSEEKGLKNRVDSINDRVSPWVFKIPTYKASRLKKRLVDILESKNN